MAIHFEMTLPRLLPILITLISLIVNSTRGFSQSIYEFDSSVEVVVNGKELAFPWAGGLNSGQYRSIDLNRDGKSDLVIFDRTSMKVNTFLWTEAGYMHDPDYEALFPSELNAWMIIVDFNCDGVEDLISSSVFGMKAYEGTLQNEKLKWSLLMDPITTEGFSSMVNLQVNSADIPAIVDIDDDGDLDIFVFNFARGGTIEYHQNLSMDNTGECGLIFKRVNSIWGDFEECTCGVYALGKRCSEITGRTLPSPQKELHAGGKSLLLFDYDGDGDKDMLFGDEECDNLAYFKNSETNGVAEFNDFVFRFPENEPAAYPFPAAYLVDVDHDGLKDLIIAPNLATPAGRQIDFAKSSSVYNNIGSPTQFEFALVAEDFLQDEMIDVGYDAAAALHDIDNDGKIDLIIGNAGHNNTATMRYYKNTGSVSQPAFSLQSEDFLNLSVMKLKNLQPGFADINGDGEADLYFTGTAEDGISSLYYLLAQNSGFGASPIPIKVNLPLGIGDNVALNQLNSDNYADLVIFRNSGRLEYYENTAMADNVDFKLEKDNFAGFTDRFENRNLTPAIYDIDADGLNELVISNASGQLFIIRDYFNHESGLQGAEAISVKNGKWNDSHHKAFGFESKIAFAPLFRGELPTMVVSGRQGGVNLLRNKSGSGSADGDSFTLDCSPVPTDGFLNIEVSEAAQIVLYNTLGKIVWEAREQSGGLKYGYDTSELTSGVYIVKAISHSGARKVRRIIVL